MTMPKEDILNRVMAQTEWYPTRPWCYSEQESGERNGTAQALRFVAAQTFLISWQRGKVPVGWTRPRKISDFSAVYGEDMVSQAKTEIERRKVRQREVEAARVAELAKTKSGPRRDVGDPTDPIQEGVQQEIRTALHNAARSQFTQTSVAMTPVDEDDEDMLLPLPSIPGAGDPDASNPLYKTQSSASKDGSAQLESVADIKGKSKAWIMAMQRKEEEAKRRKDEAAAKERQEKEQEEAKARKAEDERARRMQRSAANDLARRTSRATSGGLASNSGKLDPESGSLASQPLDHLNQRSTSKPPPRAPPTEDEVPEWARIRNEKLQTPEQRSQELSGRQAMSGDLGTRSGELNAPDSKTSNVPEWVRLRSSKETTEQNSDCRTERSGIEDDTPEFMKRAQALKSSGSTNVSPSDETSETARTAENISARSSPSVDMEEDSQPEWIKKVHALRSAASREDNQGTQPSRAVSGSGSVWEGDSANDRKTGSASFAEMVEEVEEVEDEKEDEEEDDGQTNSTEEEGTPWTAKLKKTKSNYVGGVRIEKAYSLSSEAGGEVTEESNSSEPPTNPWATALKKTKSNYVAGVRLEKPDFPSSDDENATEQPPPPTLQSALKKTKSTRVMGVRLRDDSPESKCDAENRADNTETNNPWTGVLKTSQTEEEAQEVPCGLQKTKSNYYQGVRLEDGADEGKTAPDLPLSASLKKTKSNYYNGVRIVEDKCSIEDDPEEETVVENPAQWASEPAPESPEVNKSRSEEEAWSEKNESWAAEMRRSGIRVEETVPVEVDDNVEQRFSQGKGDTNSAFVAEFKSLKAVIEEMEHSLHFAKQRLAKMEVLVRELGDQ